MFGANRSQEIKENNHPPRKHGAKTITWGESPHLKGSRPTMGKKRLSLKKSPAGGKRETFLVAGQETHVDAGKPSGEIRTQKGKKKGRKGQGSAPSWGIVMINLRKGKLRWKKRIEVDRGAPKHGGWWVRLSEVWGKKGKNLPSHGEKKFVQFRKGCRP